MSTSTPSERSESAPSETPALDRRAFLGGVGVAAGAALAASLMPVGAAQAASLEAPAAAPQAPGSDAAGTANAADGAAAGPDAPWDIDDMWGHWPRYAHPIPYARIPPPTTVWEQIDPVDRALVV